jgi:uncharacterized protein (UPF0335 family)
MITEQDRQIVEAAKRCTASDTERHLVLIIERLDAEIKKLKADLAETEYLIELSDRLDAENKKLKVDLANARLGAVR